MSEKIDVLAIDDDKFVQKLIAKGLESDDMAVRSAFNGEVGIEMANENVPDVILLDVEMPGINGYETCERLRNSIATCEVPIIFLSSRSSLRERMQGYEVGGDDYLVKPFEKENLQARINVLVGYQQERIALQKQYELAQKTAVTALTGTSELGFAIQFLENSISYGTTDELMKGLFSGVKQFGLDCCAMVITGAGTSWHTYKSAISPIEKELLEMSDRQARFLDFGNRTIVNYPMISLLARNMPLDDMERYGRVKDLLPIFLSAVNVKLSSIETKMALNQQSSDMLASFKNIRQYLFQMGTTIVNNRGEGKAITDRLIHNLHSDLLSMGLEEDQEEYLLELVDSVLAKVADKLDAGAEIRSVLSYILDSLKQLIEKQETILVEFNQNIVSESKETSYESDDSIELF